MPENAVWGGSSLGLEPQPKVSLSVMEPLLVILGGAHMLRARDERQLDALGLPAAEVKQRLRLRNKS